MHDSLNLRMQVAVFRKVHKLLKLLELLGSGLDKKLPRNCGAFFYVAGATPGQLVVVYSLEPENLQVQPVVALRVSVMVWPRTGAGALSSVQVMVPVPSATFPDAANVQFCVAAVPPFTLVMLGSVDPALITSSKLTLSAEASAIPAVTFDRA